MKIQRGAGSESLSAFNSVWQKRFCLASINRRLAGETGRAYEQRRGSKSQKVAELTPRNLRFLIAFIRKLSLKRRGCLAYIVFV